MLYTLKMTLSGSESPRGHCPWTPGRSRCASLASLTPLAIIIHNYFPPLRLGWLQPWSWYCIYVNVSTERHKVLLMSLIANWMNVYVSHTSIKANTIWSYIQNIFTLPLYICLPNYSWIFLLQLKSVKKGSVAWAAATALSYFYMVSVRTGPMSLHMLSKATCRWLMHGTQILAFECLSVGLGLATFLITKWGHCHVD